MLHAKLDREGSDTGSHKSGPERNRTVLLDGQEGEPGFAHVATNSCGL